MDMIHSLHVVKEGGVPYLEFPVDSTRSSLVSMFCSALKMFGRETMETQPESIRFSNGTSISFKEFKIDGISCQIFITHDSKQNVDVSSFALKIKWVLQENNIFSKSQPPASVLPKITQLIGSFNDN